MVLQGISYFSDSTLLSMCTVPSIVTFWIPLVMMLLGILLVTLPSPFFISLRAPMTTDIVSLHILLISISTTLYWNNLSMNFWEGISSRWNCHVHDHAPSFFLVLDDNVSVYRHIPGYCDLYIWLVFVPLLSGLYFVTPTGLLAIVCF